MTYIAPWLKILDMISEIVLDSLKGPIAEIGIGHSSAILLKHAVKYDLPFFTCDKNENKCDWLETYAKENFPYFAKLHIYRGYSWQFMEQFTSKPALVFLDGNHHYKNIKSETEFFLDKCLSNAAILLHDSYTIDEWVQRKIDKGRRIAGPHYVRQEMEKNDKVWCLTFPYDKCGITMIIKKEENRSPWRQ